LNLLELTKFVLSVQKHSPATLCSLVDLLEPCKQFFSRAAGNLLVFNIPVLWFKIATCPIDSCSLLRALAVFLQIVAFGAIGFLLSLVLLLAFIIAEVGSTQGFGVAVGGDVTTTLFTLSRS
jgi:hypothetical protein